MSIGSGLERIRRKKQRGPPSGQTPPDTGRPHCLYTGTPAASENLSIDEYLEMVRNDYKRGLFVTVSYELDYQSDIFYNNKRIKYKIKYI